MFVWHISLNYFELLLLISAVTGSILVKNNQDSNVARNELHELPRDVSRSN